MPKKKDQLREIPIEFDDSGGSAEEGEPQPAMKVQENVEEADEQPKVAARSEKAQPSDAFDPDLPPGGGVENSDLQVQIESLTAERSILYDQLLRRQAEFENYRKRIERERAETFQRSRADVLLEMIPILDNLERALLSLEESEGDPEATRHGVELIHKQFKDALTKFGLRPVESLGCTFDPHVHEAVTIEPTDEHKENTIIEEFQRGYKIGDRLLRPAKVKVASQPER
ncbi:MAG TPA: nucleotide exchange factor GrpE [Blastocatellia bacterium]|jgi:molecular chaperone GrpE|nr:nucleotide exchange factor GrpE [Blastocatellia bacterium]